MATSSYPAAANRGPTKLKEAALSRRPCIASILCLAAGEPQRSAATPPTLASPQLCVVVLLTGVGSQISSAAMRADRPAPQAMPRGSSWGTDPVSAWILASGAGGGELSPYSRFRVAPAPRRRSTASHAYACALSLRACYVHSHTDISTRTVKVHQSRFQKFYLRLPVCRRPGCR
eukprot:COSAG02_NODE_12631_length_1517_cov_1.385755_2_plen_175_part_00